MTNCRTLKASYLLLAVNLDMMPLAPIRRGIPLLNIKSFFLKTLVLRQKWTYGVRMDGSLYLHDEQEITQQMNMDMKSL